MATITTNTFLDGGVARTAGETWTCNGGILTIRTDSRWHANSPASMTGTIGSVNVSSTLGGGYMIDGTMVRWLPISGGSGTCAIGTTITQGGVSGYFLGYWASMTSAPSTTIGDTGFIKFREVTGGQFQAGALGGISATAAGPDVAGWIEVVHDQAATITIPRLGFSRTRGEWFYFENTTGVAGQVIQFPTNGSTTTYATGVWIEKSPGSDDYEFYPSLISTLMVTANLGTDIRSKFVAMNTTGGVIIGSNGSETVGYVPPAGCKVRVPNIFVRQSVTTARNTNALPHATSSSRPEFVTTSAGVIDHEMCNSDWWYNISQPSQVRLRYVSFMDTLNISECATAIDMYECHNNINASLDFTALNLTSNFAGGVVENCKLHRYSAGANDHSIIVSYCTDVTIRNVESGIIQYARSSGKFKITNSTRIKTENIVNYNQESNYTTVFGCTFKNTDHVDRYVGVTNATSPQYAVSINGSSDNCLIEGVTFGLNGTIENVNPYSGVVYVGQCTNIKIRNIGTHEAPLNGGTANQPAYIIYDGGNSDTIKMQRCYVRPTRTAALYTQNSTKNVICEHIHGDYADANYIAFLNGIVRNIGGTTTTSGQNSVYGTHFSDYFTSETQGRLLVHFNEPTTETAPYLQSSFSAGSGFTSAGNVSMAKVGDYTQAETQYFIKGHTGFQNVTPTFTGTNTTTKHSFVYQIDTGAGFGEEKALTAANLSSEIITPDVGFKFRIKSTCTVADNLNLLTYIAIQTTTTDEAQKNNLYPLDQNTVTFTGLPVGTDMVVLTAGTNNVLYQADSYGNTSIPYLFSGAHTVDVGFIKPGYVPFYIRGLALTASDTSILVTLTTDRNYQ